MDDADAEILRQLTTRTLAIRDVVVRLLAYEARRYADTRLFFEGFSRTTEQNLQAVTQDEPDDATALEFQERLQREVDGIVGAARVEVERTAKKDP